MEASFRRIKMNSRPFILVAAFFFFFASLHTANRQFFKLEKTATSKLPDDLIVPDLKSITVDPKGNVFAFAGKPGGNECFVVKFDENLVFLKRIGSTGKGPGSFSTAANGPENRLSVDINGDIVVSDHNPHRFIIFDNDGNYKADIPLERDFSNSIGRLSMAKTVGGGIFAGLQYRGELPTIGLLFSIKPPQVKARYPFAVKRIYLLLRGTVQFNRAFCGENCLFDTDSQHVVFADSQLYKFLVYDRNGVLKLEVEDKERSMGTFNDREMEEIIADHLTPKTGYSQIRNSILAQFNADRVHYRKTVKQIKHSKNVIADIKISGDRLFVFPVHEDITIKDKFPVEIYDLRGRMIATGYFTQVPDAIWKDSVFFCDRDEDDNPLIFKYRVLDLPTPSAN